MSLLMRGLYNLDSLMSRLREKVGNDGDGSFCSLFPEVNDKRTRNEKNRPQSFPVKSVSVP